MSRWHVKHWERPAHTTRAGVVGNAAGSAARHLARLKEVLQDSASLATPPNPTSSEADARDVLASLRHQWQVDKEPEREIVTPTRKGVRAINGAIEYDLSTYIDELDDDYAGLEHASGMEPAPAKRLPRELRCFDMATIHVKAGDGGNGCCAFRREKFVARGGPAGGNGGDGGSVWAEADEGMNALTAFRNQVHWKAASGVSGQGKDLHGANAPDLTIRVPVGTVVRTKGDEIGGALVLAELLGHGDRALLVQGGRGGRGNAAFKSARNRAPVLAEDGEAGQGVWLDLELKLIADVGIIGMPSAGKSTLLRALSSARPKVAPYPFTTLVPQLGVCELDMQTTVFADVPGLVEGAHLGRGLGHEFLRHVSRARVLVHVLDGLAADAIADFRAVRAELELFGGADLLATPFVVAYNKIDLPESGDYVRDVAELLERECGVPVTAVVPVSAAAGEGVVTLVRRVRDLLRSLPPAAVGLTTNALNLQAKSKHARQDRIGDYTVEADHARGRTWLVHGVALERFVQMTDWSYFEAVLRFERVLKACGLWAELERRGVRVGDNVVIGGFEFSWSEEKSEGQMYEAWWSSVRSQGRVGKGSARWPHMSG